MHAFAIVLVKPGDDVASEVERLMAPFGEGSEAYEAQFDAEGDELAGYVPGAFWWDWYRIGGRWDGTIRGLEYESADGCRCSISEQGLAMTGDSSACHYSSGRHETLERNVVAVIEMGECRPFTLVTPEGEVRHREHWVSDPEQGDQPFPYALIDDEGFDRWCGEHSWPIVTASRSAWITTTDPSLLPAPPRWWWGGLRYPPGGSDGRHGMSASCDTCGFLARGEADYDTHDKFADHPFTADDMEECHVTRVVPAGARGMYYPQSEHCGRITASHLKDDAQAIADRHAAIQGFER